MNYADKLGVPYVIFLGEDEIKQNKVSLKDMRTGEQLLMDADEARTRILNMLKQDSSATPILDRAD